jgi:hypothetical protein
VLVAWSGAAASGSLGCARGTAGAGREGAERMLAAPRCRVRRLARARQGHAPACGVTVLRHRRFRLSPIGVHSYVDTKGATARSARAAAGAGDRWHAAQPHTAPASSHSFVDTKGAARSPAGGLAHVTTT